MLARDPAARAALHNQYGVANMLKALREAGAEEQIRALIDRLPAEGRFDVFCKQSEHQMRYRFGRETDGSPAPAWDWEDLD